LPLSIYENSGICSFRKSTISSLLTS